MKKLVSILLVIMLLGTQLVFAEEKTSGDGPVHFTFAQLTNISIEKVKKISIGCSKSGLGLSEFSISSPLIISNIFNSVKNMQFEKEITTAGGSAGGWLYGINFYMEDGTYIQFGTRIHIDKVDYNAVFPDIALEEMAYYHDLIKNIDSSEWATDYILECQEFGFLEDVTNLSYREPITREKFCEILFNIYSKSIENPKTWNIGMYPIFEDCNNEKVVTLYLEGIIRGKGDTLFAPNDYLTREEAATILIRYVNKFTPMPTTEMYFEYDDISEVSEWASDSVQIISNLGIMEGVGDNKFAPKDTYTAEQAIATIMRLYNKNN